MTNFWPIGNGKHMLLFLSHKRAAQYYIGDCDQSTHRLIPNYHGRMSYGPLAVGSLHAPSATIGADELLADGFPVEEVLQGDQEVVLGHDPLVDKVPKEGVFARVLEMWS